MIPDLPEIIILLFICLVIVGLMKLETIGEWVWRLRSSSTDTAGSDDSTPPRREDSR